MELWNAFLEDYADEVFNWSLRQTLEIFWHYNENGSESVADFFRQRASQQADSSDTQKICRCPYCLDTIICGHYKNGGCFYECG